VQDEPDPRVEAVWTLARTQLASQVATIDELRARVGTLIAAAAIATGFLAGQALNTNHGMPAGAWVGTIAGFAVLVGCGIILWPRNWAGQFVNTAAILDNIDDQPEQKTVDGFKRFMTATVTEKVERNKDQLGRLYLGVLRRGRLSAHRLRRLDLGTRPAVRSSNARRATATAGRPTGATGATAARTFRGWQAQRSADRGHHAVPTRPQTALGESRNARHGFPRHAAVLPNRTAAAWRLALPAEHGLVRLRAGSVADQAVRWLQWVPIRAARRRGLHPVAVLPLAEWVALPVGHGWDGRAKV
jgi:hypothetical protein